MSKIKEVLRLKYCNQLSNRQIQTMTGVSRNSVANYIKSYIALGSTLDEVLSLSDKDLQELFTVNKPKIHHSKRLKNIHPDWNEVREELSKKGMTKLLLWQEYKEKNSNLYSYSQFNRYYAKYVKYNAPKI
jgi:predicted DNA-binding protein YlxM (UPF0122 family)